MRFDNSPRDGQPDSYAWNRPSTTPRTAERLEACSLLIGRNADPLVGDLDGDTACVLTSSRLDPPTLR